MIDDLQLPRVFIGGPFSKPDPLYNLNVIVKLRDLIEDSNIVHTVCPLCDTFQWGTICPREYDTQVKFCLLELATCDLAIFIRGESKGVEQEIKLCKKLNIPFFWYDDLQDFWECVMKYNNSTYVPKWASALLEGDEKADNTVIPT